MSRPRVRRVSTGPRAGSSRPSGGGTAWWTHAQPRRVGPTDTLGRSFGPPDHAADEARTSRRLELVAGLVSAVQLAPDEEAVMAALANALRDLGLNGYASVLAGDRASLVGRMLAVSASGAAEIERLAGRALVGARIELADATPYLAAMGSGRAVRVDAPLWWARLAAPGLGQRQAEAVARLIELREVALAPIAAGDEVLGVLTVWAVRLDDADVALTEILGRVAGVALAGLASGAAPSPAGTVVAAPTATG
jgi:hypothetical protein